MPDDALTPAQVGEIQPRAGLLPEATGTRDCPICGFDAPHGHSSEEMADRPYIDGARAAFEVQARAFMTRGEFTGWRTGTWWSADGKDAAKELGGWGRREYPWGPYTVRFVQVMWEFWRLAWIAARRNGK